MLLANPQLGGDADAEYFQDAICRLGGGDAAGRDCNGAVDNVTEPHPRAIDEWCDGLVKLGRRIDHCGAAGFDRFDCRR
jgi:hypothetical protein